MQAAVKGVAPKMIREDGTRSAENDTLKSKPSSLNLPSLSDRHLTPQLDEEPERTRAKLEALIGWWAREDLRRDASSRESLSE